MKLQKNALELLLTLPKANKLETLKGLIQQYPNLNYVLACSKFHNYLQHSHALGIKTDNVRKTIDVSRVLRLLLLSYENIDLTNEQLTNDEHILFSVMSSPSILGLTTRTLDKLNLPEFIDFCQELVPDFNLNTPQKHAETCKICGRQMQRFARDVQVCSTCFTGILSYLQYRVGYFEIPKNYFNFSLWEKNEKFPSFSFKEGSWGITITTDKVKCRLVGDGTPAQYPLPFEEFQVPLR